MSGFLLRILGFDKMISDITKVLDEDVKQSVKELIYPVIREREDSISILKEILREYNLNLEIKENRNIRISESRRLAALACNVTPLNIENPENILWKLAETIKPKGANKCQKSQQ
ncbi:hypothetical protein [Saccharolobus solfataricus]|uniref:RNase L inhibitor n=1 Tax=Saccharolobus solfataricus TaxID=2287 RepID=A0A157T056_SACSO|nr:hypothetical protein [Saccharolobus solfataricus]SAI84833.1 RNase L inhibitor [Saccharolobus solfataricus]